ncbi:MAG TPA: hypothetical protein DDW52_01335 [Planctomycetaceae bacterium]|nr:hypothetical protein [Planctomycetaceae bacterium]
MCKNGDNHDKLAVKLSPSALAETRALQRIEHENIVELVKLPTLPPNVVVTRWIEAPSLWTARGFQASLARFTEVLRPLAAAIAAVHKAGMVHGDICPDNILIGQEATGLKLIDFELAHFPGQPEQSTGQRSRGTPITISPECAAGNLATPASDVYSLGCTAYFLATGQPPHTGRTSIEICYKHLKLPCPPLKSDGLSNKLCTLVDQMLLRDPQDRPTIAEVAAELEVG